MAVQYLNRIITPRPRAFTVRIYILKGIQIIGPDFEQDESFETSLKVWIGDKEKSFPSDQPKPTWNPEYYWVHEWRYILWSLKK
jgi:hypothetical protein